MICVGVIKKPLFMSQIKVVRLSNIAVVVFKTIESQHKNHCRLFLQKFWPALLSHFWQNWRLLFHLTKLFSYFSPFGLDVFDCDRICNRVLDENLRYHHSIAVWDWKSHMDVFPRPKFEDWGKILQIGGIFVPVCNFTKSILSKRNGNKRKREFS